MSESTPAPAGAPPPEVVAAVEKEHARRDEQIAKRLRQSWGGDDSGVHRGMAAVELTRTRLGITDEAVADFEHWVGPEVATEMARSIGESLSIIDPETTPAEARERMRELRSDQDFLAKLTAGDVRSIKLWDAFNSLAAFAGR